MNFKNEYDKGYSNKQKITKDLNIVIKFDNEIGSFMVETLDVQIKEKEDENWNNPPNQIVSR